MQTLLVIGGSGQVGTELVRQAQGRYRVIAPTHAELEMTDGPAVVRALEQHRPDVVVNTAAFVRVDDCEKEVTRAFAVNAEAVGTLALGCEARGVPLVHFSTDYVFGLDAGRRTPYREDDAPGPLSVYGGSKLAGEYLVRSRCSRHLVIRTSGVYGARGSRAKGGNFIEAVLARAKSQPVVRVVDDQVTVPTSAGDLARATLELMERGAQGLVHVTQAGACSWLEVAALVFRHLRIVTPLEATTSAALALAARRPAYSVLDTTRLRELGVTPLAPWDEAVVAYLDQRA